jgi:TRAP-type C4-dicarboxylate transport system permease small subunit
MVKLYDAVMKMFEWILFLLFALLVFTVFANVLSRFALHNSLPWAEELSRFLFVWITFIGAVLVNRTFSHMRLDILAQSLPQRIVLLLELVVSFFVAGVMCIMMIGGYSMMIENLDYASPAMEIPYGIVNSIVPACCVLMFLQALARCVMLIKNAKGGIKC